MKNKGFTLVELLAVIVILGLLMAIAVPSALKMSQKVKAKSYDTKIDLVEKAGEEYGNANKSLIMNGYDLNKSNHYYCGVTTDEDGEVSAISYQAYGGSYTESAFDSFNTTATTNASQQKTTRNYWCTRVKVEDLVKANYLNYDKTGECATNNSGCTTDDLKSKYDDVVTNPKNDYIINTCYVYIYYKYKRVYSYFDVESCSNTCTNGKCESYGEGHEYRPLS